MTKKIIAFTSSGGSTDEVPISVHGESMSTIKEGDWCTVEMRDDETLSTYLIAGTTNNLIARNKEEEDNQAYFDYSRSRTTIEDVENGFTLKQRARNNTYVDGKFTVRKVIELVIGQKPKTVSKLPRPILSDEIVSSFNNFVDQLKALTDMSKYMKFGQLLSKSDGKNIKNYLSIPNFTKSSKHFGFFADTGHGKSSAFGYFIKKILVTTISLMIIDPKSEFYNGTLISTKNLKSKAREAGREIYNISIFANIFFTPSDINFEKLLLALSVFTERNFISINGKNKNSFLQKFSVIVFEKFPNFYLSSFTENDVVELLEEFTDDSVAMTVYKTKKRREDFINEIKEVCNDSRKINFLTQNLNNVSQHLKDDSTKYSVEDLVRNIFLLKENKNTPLIFINFSSTKQWQPWIKENYMNFILSEISSVINETLSDPDIEKVDALFCVDEANKYFPTQSDSNNKFIKSASKDIVDILNHWGRSKGFGLGLACPDPTQLNSEILERIVKKSLFLGYGLKSSFLNTVSGRADVIDVKELEKIDPLVEDENSLLESCQFFMVGMKSLLDDSGKGLVIELTKKDFEE